MLAGVVSAGVASAEPTELQFTRKKF